MQLVLSAGDATYELRRVARTLTRSSVDAGSSPGADEDQCARTLASGMPPGSGSTGELVACVPVRPRYAGRPRSRMSRCAGLGIPPPAAGRGGRPAVGRSRPPGPARWLRPRPGAGYAPGYRRCHSPGCISAPVNRHSGQETRCRCRGTIKRKPPTAKSSAISAKAIACWRRSARGSVTTLIPAMKPESSPDRQSPCRAELSRLSHHVA
jgi:hypothetical protein